jgi:hypothetical protein
MKPKERTKEEDEEAQKNKDHKDKRVLILIIKCDHNLLLVFITKFNAVNLFSLNCF